MSVEIPVVAVVFGSVAPPQGDVLELSVHLGCTKEVSSFSCMLQNFDKKYSPGQPDEIVEGTDGSISIGRGADCPLIATIRVEDVEHESSPLENYVRVKGRCWGEKLFRRVVTKTYENQKGEAIVKDLIDSYVGLSHNRLSDLTSDAAAGQPDCVVADGSNFHPGDQVTIADDDASEQNEVASVSGNTVTMVNSLVNTYTVLANGKLTSELIEDTDTTYTLLEYENTPVFDVLKYIASSADRAGVIGYDMRVEHDGKFRFFPRNSKTSPVSLSERIEHSRFSKDIHRVRNKITVFGAAEKAKPANKDSWTEDLTKQGTGSTAKLIHADGEWTVGAGDDINVDASEKIVGSKSVKLTVSGSNYYGRVLFTFYTGKTVNSNKYPSLTFQLKIPDDYSGAVTVQLIDGAEQIVRREIHVQNNGEWSLQTFSVGKKASDQWTIDIFNTQHFNWENIWRIDITCHFLGTGTGSFWVDNLFFNRRRWEATQEDSTSQSNYGLRELVEVDEELHSDNECSLRAKALLAHLKDPAEYLTLRSNVIDYDTNPILPGDKIHVTLPNENIDADYRIISVEYRVTATEQTLEITLELGKEQSLLADYLYALRSKTRSLARTKAGK